MELPMMADRKPMQCYLSPGTYWWCACGLSKKQPYCDGSHQGTGFLPVQLKVDDHIKVMLCCCKQTADRPFCDGTHRDLSE